MVRVRWACTQGEARLSAWQGERPGDVIRVGQLGGSAAGQACNANACKWPGAGRWPRLYQAAHPNTFDPHVLIRAGLVEQQCQGSWACLFKWANHQAVLLVQHIVAAQIVYKWVRVGRESKPAGIGSSAIPGTTALWADLSCLWLPKLPRALLPSQLSCSARHPAHPA